MVRNWLKSKGQISKKIWLKEFEVLAKQHEGALCVKNAVAACEEDYEEGHTPWNSFQVYWNGLVRGCERSRNARMAMDREDRLRIGNVKEEG